MLGARAPTKLQKTCEKLAKNLREDSFDGVGGMRGAAKLNKFAKQTCKNVRMLPNASGRFRTHPDVSERIRIGPNRSEHVPKPPKTHENLQKSNNLQKEIAKNRDRRVRAVVVFVVILSFPSTSPWGPVGERTGRSKVKELY